MCCADSYLLPSFVVVRISATLLNSLTLNKYSPCFSFPVQFRLPEIRMVHFLIWGFRGLLGLLGDGFELGFGSIVLLSVILLVIPSIDIMVVHFTLYLSLFIFSLSLSIFLLCEIASVLNKCWFKCCRWSQFMEVKLKFYGVMHLPRIFILNGWSLPVLNRSCFSVFNGQRLSNVFIYSYSFCELNFVFLLIFCILWWSFDILSQTRLIYFLLDCLL